MLRRKIPPPPPIPATPSPLGRWRPRLGHTPRAFRPPARPRPHPAMVEARARAERLRRPRRPRLERGRLHRDHAHTTEDYARSLDLRRYVVDRVQVTIDRPSPWGAFLMGHALNLLEAQVPPNQWDYGWRVRDLRTWLEEAGPAAAWGGRSDS